MSEYPTTTGIPGLDDAEAQPAEAELLSSTEVTNSLTGFDELAIAQRFGASVEELAETSNMRFLRSLLFIVEKRREGVSDADAFKAAMSLPFGELTARFRPEDPADDLPGSPVGEGLG